MVFAADAREALRQARAMLHHTEDVEVVDAKERAYSLEALEEMAASEAAGSTEDEPHKDND